MLNLPFYSKFFSLPPGTFKTDPDFVFDDMSGLIPNFERIFPVHDITVSVVVMNPDPEHWLQLEKKL